jgi:hypothetical protein
MGLPSHPVILSVEQIAELSRKLSTMRHDVNNTLSLIAATGELLLRKPQTAERMVAALLEEPPKIAAALSRFSAEFERAVGVTPD